MRRKDTILIAGAIAAGAQAVASKSTNPNVTMILVFLGVGLAWYADHPREGNSRIGDEKIDEVNEAKMEGKE
jgi:hypothetical protein